MTDQRTAPPTFVLAALAGGFLFIAGGVVTAMDTSSRAIMAAAAVCFFLVGAFAFTKVRQVQERNGRIRELELEVLHMKSSDTGLRTRMAVTLREPLTSIVGYADQMMTNPDMTADQRLAVLTEMRNGAREVELVLSDLAGDEVPVTERTAQGVVLLDEELRSIMATTPQGLEFETDLRPARAWADSATVRQILRAVIGSARANGSTHLTVKTHESAKIAGISIAARDTPLPEDAIAALTGMATGSDVESRTHVGLRQAHLAAASMGGRIGYAEAFGQAHIVVEFIAAPEQLELTKPVERPRPEQGLQYSDPESEPNLSFASTVGLRPERPSAAIRFS